MCKTNHVGLPQVLDHTFHPVSYVIIVSPQYQLDSDLDLGLLRVWVWV